MVQLPKISLPHSLIYQDDEGLEQGEEAFLPHAEESRDSIAAENKVVLAFADHQHRVPAFYASLYIKDRLLMHMTSSYCLR